MKVIVESSDHDCRTGNQSQQTWKYLLPQFQFESRSSLSGRVSPRTLLVIWCLCERGRSSATHRHPRRTEPQDRVWILDPGPVREDKSFCHFMTQTGRIKTNMKSELFSAGSVKSSCYFCKLLVLLLWLQGRGQRGAPSTVVQGPLDQISVPNK